MPLWLRRTIYISFIALFLIVAPILALYSMGYRYQWQKQRIERTGLIIVSGEPTDARVIINGVERARGLPARIGGLGANAYDIRVERDGYLTIERRIVVASGQTSFLADVTLFRRAEPTLVAPGMMAEFVVSANRAWAAYASTSDTASEVWFIDLRTTVRTLALRITHPFPRGKTNHRPLALAWATKDARLLVTNGNDGSAYVITPGLPPEIMSLRGKFARVPSDIRWELGGAPALIALAGDRVQRLALTTNRSTTLRIAPPKHPFGVSRQHLFTVRDAQIMMTPINGGTAEPIVPLPSDASVAEFDALDGDTLTVRTRYPDAILTINIRKRTLAAREGHRASRAPDDNRALLWQRPPAEVWVEIGDPPNVRLLTRRADSVIQAIWHPNGRDILISTTQDITAVTLDERNGWTTTPIAAFDAIRNIVVTTNGAVLLILGRRGTDDGLWSLALR